MNGYYEHHLAIRKDRLCPFKLAKATDSLSVPCNWHENIEILLVTGGQGAIQYGGDALHLEPHDIIIINSGTLHRPYSDTGISYYYLIIDEEFCKENGLSTSLFRFREQFRDERTEELFIDVTRKMNVYRQLRDALNTAKLRGSVLSLLIDICSRHTLMEDASKTDNKHGERYVKQVIDYVNENYAQPITLDTLAAHCGITKYHLTREFKRFTGQTVFTYINLLRCRIAETYLSAGKSVTESALSSGFESLSYFSRTYKSLIGVSPSKRK